MPTILEKANQIKTEKNTKIIPANIKAGTTIFNITGSLVELNGQTKTVNPSTVQQTIEPDQEYNALTRVTVNAVDNTIDENITPNNIKSGATILGINGSSKVVDTTDATAVAGDMLSGKTAYVDGQKLTGNIQTTTGSIQYQNNLGVNNIDIYSNKICFGYNYSYLTEGYYKNAKVSYLYDQSVVAQAIGLTADKIKKGVTILGITGTYEPDYESEGTITPTEYQENLELAQNILGDNGEE